MPYHAPPLFSTLNRTPQGIVHMGEADQPAITGNSKPDTSMQGIGGHSKHLSRWQRLTLFQRQLMRSGARSEVLHLSLAALALAAMFGLTLGFSLNSAPTFDEGMYIGRGWAFLKTGHLMPLGHPPLTNVLSGFGVLL